jgi:hypothetical protein
VVGVAVEVLVKTMVFVQVDRPMGVFVGLLVKYGVRVAVAELAHVLVEVAVIVIAGIEVLVGFDGEVGELELSLLEGQPWRTSPHTTSANNQTNLLNTRSSRIIIISVGSCP